MKVLITGGLGFLGTQLAQLLLNRGTISNRDEQQVPITSIVLFDTVAPSTNLVGAMKTLLADHRVSTVIGQIHDPSTCMTLIDREDMCVFHLAGVMSGASEVNWDLAWNVNVIGAHCLLQACRARACGLRVVFTSTIAIFGERDDPTVKDDTKLRPLNTYGMSKAMCELLVNDMTRKSFIDGRVARLPTVIARPGLPNAATTSCFSGIIREPLAGVDVEIPVPRDLDHAVIGHRCCVQGIADLHDVPLADMERVCGSDRAVNIPSLSTNLQELAEAMRRVAAENGIRPGTVTFKPDPDIARIVASMAGATDSARATALGIQANPPLDDLVRQYLADFGVAGSALYAGS
mmetsp:Transcript_78655/g.138955  ORF Transcript_78655/g.138955 Transcript_78655/m.138955 type:complete len:348 (-) Transcript_78655:70-1113(-)